MLQLNNLGNEPIQRHTIPLGDDEIILILRFFPTVEIWKMDVTFKGESINGVKLSLGVLHMRSQNWPFDFVVSDNSQSGIDPFQSIDFETNRCSLFILEPEDMEEIRGFPVEI